MAREQRGDKMVVEPVDLPQAQHEAWFEMLRAHSALVKRIDKRLAQAGQVPLVWYDVLVSLEKSPDHRLRLADLAEAVVLSRSGLSRVVDRLEEAGLLRREACGRDRRSAFAVLTEAGLEARRGAWGEHSRGIVELWAQHVSDEEARILARVLGRVADAAMQGCPQVLEGGCGGPEECPQVLGDTLGEAAGQCQLVDRRKK